MKNIYLLIALLFLSIGLFAQSTSWAKVVIPPGQQFAQNQEHQLQIMIGGFSSSSQNIKSYITDLSTVAGVNYFNMIIQPEQTEGYCDVRFSVASKSDFERMLRDIFCKLQLNYIQINETTFENCQQVVTP